MPVILTVSETVSGSEYADALAGDPLATGIDFGQVTNGGYAPVIDANLNTGAQVCYLRHDATVDPITNLKIYLDSYSRTGFTYGGPIARNAAADYMTLKDEGQASGVTALEKNNSSGLASGLWMEMQHDVSTTNQFDIENVRSEGNGDKFVKIFGKQVASIPQGVNEATAYTLIKEAALYWNGSSETDVVGAVDGKIGISTDSTLGNRMKLRFRVFLRSAFAEGGIFQASLVTRFSYTA